MKNNLNTFLNYPKCQESIPTRKPQLKFQKDTINWNRILDYVHPQSEGQFKYLSAKTKKHPQSNLQIRVKSINEKCPPKIRVPEMSL
jgi:hypothetical protein